MKLVVDASVAAKWLFKEQGSHESRHLLAHRIRLGAPDLILTETANVVWKKARRREISDPQPYLAELANLPDVIALRPSSDLVAHAAAIAIAIDHPVYDCLYLACAETDGAPLVTADTKLQRAAATYPSVDVWHILDPQIVERIASGATALVIEEATVREAIAAYVAFDQTAETVISKTRPHGEFQVLTPEDQDACFKTPTYLRLVKLVAALPYDERIDLMALGWYGRPTDEGSWADLLDHAYRMGADDPRYEAGLGGHWKAGLDRLIGKSLNTS